MAVCDECVDEHGACTACQAKAQGAALQVEFVGLLKARLEQGAIDYGDKSFHRPGTAEEILDELVDVAGWAFVAWVQMRMRLQGLELAAQELDDQ